jgi:hypothetical protein
MYLVLKVNSYDFFYKTVSYSLFADNLQFIKEKIRDEHKKHYLDKLYIVAFLDERWVLCVVDIRSGIYKIIDFLDEELSRMRKQ